MDFGDRLELLPFLLGMLIVTGCVHEAAHAWAAWRCGDRREEIARRKTPFTPRHLSVWFTLLIPTGMILLLGWPWGSARRLHWRSEIGDGRSALVALAGPTGNLVVAAMGLLAIAAFVHAGEVTPSLLYDRYYAHALLAVGFSLFLGAVELLPVPPLDGSKIAALLLPRRWRSSYHALALPGSIALLIAFLVLVFAYPEAFAAGAQRLTDGLHRATLTIIDWIEP